MEIENIIKRGNKFVYIFLLSFVFVQIHIIKREIPKSDQLLNTEIGMAIADIKKLKSALKPEKNILEIKFKTLEHLVSGKKYLDERNSNEARKDFNNVFALYSDLQKLQNNINWNYGDIKIYEEAIIYLTEYSMFSDTTKNDKKRTTLFIDLLHKIVDKNKILMVTNDKSDFTVENTLPRMKTERLFLVINYSLSRIGDLYFYTKSFNIHQTVFNDFTAIILIYYYFESILHVFSIDKQS